MCCLLLLFFSLLKPCNFHAGLFCYFKHPGPSQICLETHITTLRICYNCCFCFDEWLFLFRIVCLFVFVLYVCLACLCVLFVVLLVLCVCVCVVVVYLFVLFCYCFCLVFVFFKPELRSRAVFRGAGL